MSAQASQRVGWCPGALRPMESGDGFILRIKPRGGILDFERAAAIGELSLRYGNGLIDVTGRANLQIRGVFPVSIQPLTGALADLGLLDTSPEAEAIRNIVSSPLAGLDATARCKIGPLVAALEDRFARDHALHALPAKWSLVVDDGGALPLTDVSADLRFECLSESQILVGLGTDPDRGLCAPGEVADVAAAFARMILAETQPRRMQALVEAQGAKALFARADLPPAPSPFAVLSKSSERRARSLPATGRVAPERRDRTHRVAVSATEVIAWRDHGHVPFLGAAPPFASLDAQDLIHLVDAARMTGAHDLRLTPWRVMLVTGIAADSVASFASALRETALIVDPADSRLAISACVGHPACRRGTVSTRMDAARLAGLLPAAGKVPLVHLSGCDKGCAQGVSTPWTLVGREGRYDLVRDGRVADAPVARGLSIGDAASWISQAQGTRVL